MVIPSFKARYYSYYVQDMKVVVSFNFFGSTQSEAKE